MRLIDADKLRLSYWVSPTSTVSTAGQYYFYSQAEVDNAPTINAEPVVRCKDCIYFHDYGDGVKNCWGDGGGIFTKDDDFCSHAERKDG